MFVKVMSDQHRMEDRDKRKQFKIFDDVNKFEFSFIDNKAFVRIVTSKNETFNVPVHGNIYILNELGDIISSHRPEWADGWPAALDKPESMKDQALAAAFGAISDYMIITSAGIEILQGRLDKLEGEK